MRAGTHGLEVATTIELEHGAGTRETRLEPDVEIAIYRTVQESLTNAAKHAGARAWTWWSSSAGERWRSRFATTEPASTSTRRPAASG